MRRSARTFMTGALCLMAGTALAAPDPTPAPARSSSSAKIIHDGLKAAYDLLKPTLPSVIDEDMDFVDVRLDGTNMAYRGMLKRAFSEKELSDLEKDARADVCSGGAANSILMGASYTYEYVLRSDPVTVIKAFTVDRC